MHKTTGVKSSMESSREHGATTILLALVMAAALLIGLMVYLSQRNFSLSMIRQRRLSTARDYVTLSLRRYSTMAPSIRYSLPYSTNLDSCVRGTGCPVVSPATEDLDFFLPIFPVVPS